jgi:hypothetical protein
MDGPVKALLEEEGGKGEGGGGVGKGIQIVRDAT